MEYTEILNVLLKMFQKQIDSDKTVRRFYAKVRDGTATYKDVYDLAAKAGSSMYNLLHDAFLEQFPNGIPPEAINVIIPPALREQCETVISGADQVQSLVNKAAGVRLSPVQIVPNEERIAGLAEHFKTDGFTEEANELITNLSRSTVDDTIESNAEFQKGSGMKVTVTRIYDGVGVNHGRDPCQWCLDRCGEDVDFAEAKQMGMFERHTGCGCTIEYKSVKGTKRQTDWTRNVWADSEEILKRRRSIGL